MKLLRPPNRASFPLRNYALCLIAAIILAGCSRSVAETSVDESTSAGSKSASSPQQVSEHTTAAKPPAASESDSVFGLTKLWNIHVRVSKENWAAMQPKSGGFPGFGPPGGGPPGRGFGPPPSQDQKKEPSKGTPQQGPPQAGRPPGGFGPPPNHRPGSFGFEFEYVKADVEFDGQSYKDVGLRFKGNGTYMMSSGSHKRPMKIDFNRFVDDQTFFGMQQLNLHNNVMDPTHLRTVVSYPVFQKAGVPSPQTAYAEVRLTIDGEAETDNELIGLYTIVEEVDKAFLRRHFPSDDGMLLKPEGTQGLEYKGEDWADYAWFEPKSKPSKEQQKRLIEITRLIEKADDQKFRDEIGQMLCVDQFARFLAANVLLSNMDSFLTNVHNYYVYLPPETNRFEFLPWDMDLSLGTFFLAGQPEQLADLSINHPHVGSNKLIERLMAWDEFRSTYHGHLRTLNEECFSENGATVRDLPILRTAIADLLKRDQERAAKEAEKMAALAPPGGPGGFGPPRFGGPGGPGGFNPFGNAPTIEEFITKRLNSIQSQLAGASEGTKPGGGFGFGPPPRR